MLVLVRLEPIVSLLEYPQDKEEFLFRLYSSDSVVTAKIFVPSTYALTHVFVFFIL